MCTSKASPQLADLQPVRFRPRLDAFLAPRHRFRDRPEAHSLAREQVEFLDFVAGPWLAVAEESFGHGDLSN